MSPFPIFLLSSSLSLSYHWKSQFYPFVNLSSSLKDNSCLLHISSVGKESTFNAGDPGSISGPGRSAGEGKGYPFQYSGLENSMDCIVHGVAKSWTWLRNWLNSAYKLNKQGDNIQPWHTPFPIWNQSVVPCPIVTVVFWPPYRLLRRQIRWSNGSPISLRIFHSLLWSTQSKALA